MSMRFIITISLLSFGLRLLSQGLAEEYYLSALLKSGKVQVKSYQDNQIHQVLHIDTVKCTIEEHRVVRTILNPVAPIFDDKYSTETLRKYFFNKQGEIDSVIIIHYIYLIQIDKLQGDTIRDTSVVIYNRPLLENRIINSRIYYFVKGTRKLYRTHYYGYDPENKIVLMLEDEGRVQYHYIYNEKGQIERETVLRATIHYSYDNLGRLIMRKSDGQVITYEYVDNTFLRKVKISKNDDKVSTQTYEYK